MVSVLISEIVNPNEARTAAISAIIFTRLFLDLQTMTASSAYSIPQIGFGSATVSWEISRPFSGLSLSPPHPLRLLRLGAHHILHHTCNGTEPLHRHMQFHSKEMVNSNSASTHPCRRPCFTPNQPEHSPSSLRMRARIPSWKCRITASIFGGTPNRASTVHKRVRSTESYALVRSTKHTQLVEVVGPQRSDRSSTVAV